jgi:hypothetical protein
MLFYLTSSVLKLVRRAQYSWEKRFEIIKNSSQCIFFREDLPIAMTFGKQLKSELAKCNISMINNVIEINNKDQEETVINRIEYVLEYLNNNSGDEIDENSDNIELEEKFKDEIDNQMDIIEANRDSTDSFVREENYYKRYVNGWNSTDCYEIYVRYCNDNGFKIKKSKTFGADIKKYCDRK